MYSHRTAQTVRAYNLAEDNNIGKRYNVYRIRQGTTNSRLGCGLDGGLLDQTSNGRRQLGTLLFPVRQAINSNTQAFFVGRSKRIVETNTLDKAAIAACAGISHNHIVERTLFGATASKTNYNHGVLFRIQKKGRIITRKREKTN
jgi:hypothetical protein